MVRFCPRCDNEIGPEDRDICPECGLNLRKEGSQPNKNPGVAIVCSFFFPGLGQVYSGNFIRGLGFLAGTIIGSFIFIIPGLIIWLYGIYDAYRTTRLMNAGRIPFSETKILHMILFIILTISIFIILMTVVGVMV